MAVVTNTTLDSRVEEILSSEEEIELEDVLDFTPNADIMEINNNILTLNNISHITNNSLVLEFAL